MFIKGSHSWLDIIKDLLSKRSTYNGTYLFEIIPEVEQSKNIIQKTGESVFEHTKRVISGCFDLVKSRNWRLSRYYVPLLSCLFHDLGKVRIISPIGSHRFPDHAIESADIATSRLLQLQAPYDIIDDVVRIVSTHMFDIKDLECGKTIRKFIADVGIHNIQYWFLVRRADILAYNGERTKTLSMLDKFDHNIMEYLSPWMNNEQMDISTDYPSPFILRGSDINES